MYRLGWFFFAFHPNLLFKAMLSETLDVRIKTVDREEYLASLTLKISGVTVNGNLAGNSRLLSPAALPVPSNGILVELISDSDLFLYFSLRLSESDFYALKMEQRLLVDFAQFPNMVKQLVGGRAMSAVLAVDGLGEGVLSLVEANQFRELVHLSLRLRSGNDESIKTYLATRLNQYKSASASLETTCAQLTDELKRVSLEKLKLDSELAKARSDSDSFSYSVQSRYQAELAQLREEHAREIRSLHLSSSSEHSGETRRLADQVRTLEERNRDTERKLEETRLTLVAAESQLNGSVRRIHSLENEVDVGMEGMKREQMEARELLGRNHDLEKRVSELSIENSGLKERLRAQIGGLESTVTSREASLTKLQSKVKDLKVALKQTQQALLQQETVVARLTREVTDGSAKLEAGREESANLKSQLANSHQLLESNAQVIAFLNKKVADGGGHGGLSRAYDPPRLNFTQNSFLHEPLSLPASHSFPTSSPISTPVIPDYPNRSSGLDSSLEHPRDRTPSLSRIMSGPVKFTARNGHSTALIK